MITMLICSLLLAVLYVGAAIWRRRELPESVSAMVYLLPRGWQYVWSVWLWAVSLLLAPALIEAVPEPLKVVAALTVAALWFVGAMPLVDAEHSDWHNRLAVLAGVLSQLCVWLVCPWWLLVWLSIPLLLAVMALPDVAWCYRLALAVEGRGVLISEIVAMVAVYGALLSWLVFNW